MKISILNYSDSMGGAARAAYRVHTALRQTGIDSTLLVDDASTGDWSVQQGAQSRWERLSGRLRQLAGATLSRTMTTANPTLHSPAIFPSKWPRIVNASDADLVHLMWINGEMLSIEDVPRIKKPLVWTLHDMWCFSGAEHFSNVEHTAEDIRPFEGYLKTNRPSHESGIDLNRLTWLRKRRAWKPMHMITPSHWMADCVRRSALMRDWPVTVIPNPIDIERWYPFAKPLARELFRLPKDKQLLLFGTAGANSDPRKGFDLLQSALDKLRGHSEIELVVFGELTPRVPPDLGFPVHYVGHLHDDLSMQMLYSAVDLVIIPSRIDNLPNVGVEALACGLPITAFNIGGLPDIVTHEQTGYLARPFDTDDLAYGITWLLSNTERLARMASAARTDAVSRFSYPTIASAHRALYEQVLNKTA